jgi:hypothetical protein
LTDANAASVATAKTKGELPVGPETSSAIGCHGKRNSENFQKENLLLT